ncbi:unnamed protein product [Paramecium pentaurelia]|uniref:Uncharacterized protein n=1 Tax=Paramecium pentaurelia TaxID=43138 RepID=A0A8S1TQ66_9CILI|nr:unnamed protein product [Paramecium pentaurelia]
MRPQVGLKIQGKLKPSDKQLIEIVNLHGGINCTSWSQVARIYESQVGVRVRKAYELKRLYISFTQYDEQFTREQLVELFESAIQSRGNSRAGSKQFEQRTGIHIYISRYTSYIKGWLRQGLKYMRDVFLPSRNKSWAQTEFYSKCQYIPPRSAFYMLKILDCNLKDYQDDFIIMDFYKCASVFQQLLYLYALNFDVKSRTEVYGLFSQMITRRMYKKIHCYAHYFEELRKINVTKICKDEQLTQHPMLARTIKKNQESSLYKLLFQEHDYTVKFKLFNESNDLDQNQFSVLLKPSKTKEQLNEQETFVMNLVQLKEENKIKSQKVPKEFIETKKKVKQKKYFRGHFIRDGTYSCCNQTTKQFDYDYDI